VIAIVSYRPGGLPCRGVLSFRGKHGRHRAVKRRDFITLVGGAAAAWPITLRAQQPAMPVIGFLHSESPEHARAPSGRLSPGAEGGRLCRGRERGLEQRWAENQMDRLPALAADLVRRQVSVIAAIGPAAAFAVKAANTTMPIVFGVPDDPVRQGLVSNL